MNLHLITRCNPKLIVQFECGQSVDRGRQSWMLRVRCEMIGVNEKLKTYCVSIVPTY